MKKLILFSIVTLMTGSAFAERTLLETVQLDRNSSPSKMDTTNEARRARQASSRESEDRMIRHRETKDTWRDSEGNLHRTRTVIPDTYSE